MPLCRAILKYSQRAATITLWAGITIFSDVGVSDGEVGGVTTINSISESSCEQSSLEIPCASMLLLAGGSCIAI